MARKRNGTSRKDKDRFTYKSLRIPNALDTTAGVALSRKGQFHKRSFNYLATEGLKIICAKILGK